MPSVSVKLPFTRKIKVSTRRSRKVSKLMCEETLDMSQCFFFCGWANCFQQDTADTQKKDNVISHQLSVILSLVGLLLTETDSSSQITIRWEVLKFPNLRCRQIERPRKVNVTQKLLWPTCYQMETISSLQDKSPTQWALWISPNVISRRKKKERKKTLL